MGFFGSFSLEFLLSSWYNESMPLVKGASKQAKRKNYLELTLGEIGATRRKAIKTIMRKRGVSFDKARRIQAGAIIQNAKKK